MKAAIDRFLSEQGRRWSPATVVRYRWYLENLRGWMEENGLPDRPEDVNQQILIRWLDSRMGWASSTQYTATVACRAFFRWAFGREASPAENLILPRRSYKPGRTLDPIRLQHLLGALDTSTPKGMRDTAMILLLLDTGLRAAEVCRLRIEHMDLSERRLMVRVKGGRWAPGVFSAYTASCLGAWLIVREKIARSDVPEFFVGIGGDTPGRRMTPDGLRAIFRQIGQRLGFHFSPHDFRRTMAHMAIRLGVPERILQEQMRLESPKQIQTYSRGINAEDFRPYSPVEKLMGFDEPAEE
jgi:site-specific recombinase XerD